MSKITRQLGSAGSGTISPSGIPSGSGGVGGSAANLARVGKGLDDYFSNKDNRERQAQENAIANRAEQRAEQRFQWAAEEQDRKRQLWDIEDQEREEEVNRQQIKEMLGVIALNYEITPQAVSNDFSELDDLDLMYQTLGNEFTGGQSLKAEAIIRGIVAKRGNYAYVNELLNNDQFSGLRSVVSMPFLQELKDKSQEYDLRRDAREAFYDAAVSRGYSEDNIEGGMAAMVELGGTISRADAELEEARIQAQIAESNASAMLSNEKAKQLRIDRRISTYATTVIGAESKAALSAVFSTIQRSEVDRTDPTPELVTHRQRLEAVRAQITSTPEFAQATPEQQNKITARINGEIAMVDEYITGDRSLLNTRNQTVKTIAQRNQIEVADAMSLYTQISSISGLSPQRVSEAVAGLDSGALQNWLGEDYIKALEESGRDGANKALEALGVTKNNLSDPDQSRWLSKVTGNLPEAKKELLRINTFKELNNPITNPDANQLEYVSSVRASANLSSNNFTPNRLNPVQAKLLTDTVLNEYETLDTLSPDLAEDVKLAKLEIAGAASNILNGLQLGGALQPTEYWEAVYENGRYKVERTRKNTQERRAMEAGGKVNPYIRGRAPGATIADSSRLPTEDRIYALKVPPRALRYSVDAANRSLDIIEDSASIDPNIPEGADNVADFFVLNAPFSRGGERIIPEQGSEMFTREDLEAEVERRIEEKQLETQRMLGETTPQPEGVNSSEQ